MRQRSRAFFGENRLWQGSRMILPEHRAGSIETMGEESLSDTCIPCPTQEYLEEIQKIIETAVAQKALITLIIKEKEKIKTLKAHPLSLGQRPGFLRLESEGTSFSIPIAAIVGVQEI
ncbi:hypothetical protein F9B85_09060 [Heliorestis acidaminivorans]|uniref:Uncharacterized protein n=1 Tax=Heliorestis acidaminivorans TaxID=553427 RepID=A0A6I0EQB7_9FIRM|nr:hypothetical protein [Heliorestis acidaminivorans]KAB2952304.1 hypothetical protein F9B85_09060 [Heliorestis acidaminivorans]